MASDSTKERSERGPGIEEEESGESGGCSVAEEVGANRRSMRDLHCFASLECPLRHDAFLMILSSAGITIWLRRESTSEHEAIPD